MKMKYQILMLPAILVVFGFVPRVFADTLGEEIAAKLCLKMDTSLTYQLSNSDSSNYGPFAHSGSAQSRFEGPEIDITRNARFTKDANADGVCSVEVVSAGKEPGPGHRSYRSVRKWQGTVKRAGNVLSTPLYQSTD